MDHSETLACKYLKQIGFESVSFEPLGNVSPDFLCDRNVAVEVRRLNRMKSLSDGEHEGLESLEFWLEKTLIKMLTNYGESLDGHTWYVSYIFQRPDLPDETLRKKWARMLKKDIHKALKEFQDVQDKKPVRLQLREKPQFELIFKQAGQVINNKQFVFTGGKDKDRGFWLTSEMIRNLRICIEEKTTGAANREKDFPSWWLILVDHINWGLDENEMDILRESIDYDRAIWNKVIILDAHNGKFKMKI